MTNALGWIGTVLIVSAYALTSWFGLDSQGVTYQAMNIVGSTCLGVKLFQTAVWSAFYLQVTWVSIGVISLVRMLF